MGTSQGYALVFRAYHAGYDATIKRIVAISTDVSRIVSERDRLSSRTVHNAWGTIVHYATTDTIYGAHDRHDEWDCEDKSCPCHAKQYVGDEGFLEIETVPFVTF